MKIFIKLVLLLTSVVAVLYTTYDYWQVRNMTAWDRTQYQWFESLWEEVAPSASPSLLAHELDYDYRSGAHTPACGLRVYSLSTEEVTHFQEVYEKTRSPTGYYNRNQPPRISGWKQTPTTDTPEYTSFVFKDGEYCGVQAENLASIRELAQEALETPDNFYFSQTFQHEPGVIPDFFGPAEGWATSGWFGLIHVPSGTMLVAYFASPRYG